MTEIVFPLPLLAEYRGKAWATPQETCAVFFAYQAPHGRMLIHEGGVVPAEAYATRSEVTAQLTPDYMFEVVQQARKRCASLILSHSHPAPSDVAFSATDDRGEAALKPYFEQRLAGLGHFSVLLTRDRLLGREIGAHKAVDIVEIGANIRRHSMTDQSSAAAISEIFERQVRAFGAAGQRLIANVKVAIVGLGGIGSIVAQELAYLGIRHFILVDPKNLTITNRNRVVGSKATDIGKPKVEIAKRMILGINESAQVDSINDDAANDHVLEQLVDAQFIFLCTDSHTSRAAVSKLCYQFLIPGIDLGVNIVARDNRVEHIVGRTQMLAPGLPCLWCCSAISADAIRRESMSLEQQAADPYFTGQGEQQPAVISLNGTMSSLAVTMFLSAVAGIPGEARYQRYDGIAGTVHRVSATPDDHCIVCSRRGAFARGSTRSLLLTG